MNDHAKLDGDLLRQLFGGLAFTAAVAVSVTIIVMAAADSIQTVPQVVAALATLIGFIAALALLRAVGARVRSSLDTRRARRYLQRHRPLSPRQEWSVEE